MNQLLALPAFTDNYVWLVHNGCDALVVDPGDAAPVQRTLAALGLRLTDILVTHHHADHVGGLSAWSPDTVAIHGAIDALPRSLPLQRERDRPSVGGADGLIDFGSGRSRRRSR